jgi:hypothetical protein
MKCSLLSEQVVPNQDQPEFDCRGKQFQEESPGCINKNDFDLKEGKTEN